LQVGSITLYKTTYAEFWLILLFTMYCAGISYVFSKVDFRYLLCADDTHIYVDFPANDSASAANRMSRLCKSILCVFKLNSNAPYLEDSVLEMYIVCNVCLYILLSLASLDFPCRLLIFVFIKLHTFASYVFMFSLIC